MALCICYDSIKMYTLYTYILYTQNFISFLLMYFPMNTSFTIRNKSYRTIHSHLYIVSMLLFLKPISAGRSRYRLKSSNILQSLFVHFGPINSQVLLRTSKKPNSISLPSTQYPFSETMHPFSVPGAGGLC